jgi:hypothetical protein
MFAAIRRASSRVSSLAAERRPSLVLEFSQPCEFGRCPMQASYSQGIHSQKNAIFFCPHAGAGFGNDSTHYPNPCRRHHERAVTGFWLASLHDGKRGTSQISQGDASLHAPKLLERQRGCARAFATTPTTRRSARAVRTTGTRGSPRNR